MANAATVAVQSKHKNRIKTSRSDRVYYLINNILLGIFFLIILIPLINVVACSFSDSFAVNSGQVFLWPVKFTLDGYKGVFTYPGIWRAYGNSFYYTIFGTVINLFMTLIAAYPLARRNLPGKGVVVALFMFTMLFSGGMIPGYLLIRDLHMINTVWSIVLPGAISVYNMIIARTFIQNIPVDLEEAAKIDGCSDFRYFVSIVLPLSKAVISVLMLYYAVGHWNDYMSALLYMNSDKKFPLQLMIRGLLTRAEMAQPDGMTEEQYQAMKNMADLLRYSLIIVSSVPVLVIYPFAKKYFMKGVMIGAVKG